jgi:hypothetical protein
VAPNLRNRISMQPMLQNPLLLGERAMVKPKKGRINYIHIAQLLQLGTNGQHKVMYGQSLESVSG